ncbi:hypothetical protein D3C76_890480 [compost metagenome]
MPHGVRISQLPRGLRVERVVGQRAAYAVHQHHFGQLQVITVGAGNFAITVQFQALRVAIVVALVFRHQRGVGIGRHERAFQGWHLVQPLHLAQHDLVLRLLTVVAVMNRMGAFDMQAQGVALCV